MVVERDASEFARLSQLGDILGLTPLEVSSVHSQLAEQGLPQPGSTGVFGAQYFTSEIGSCRSRKQLGR